MVAKFINAHAAADARQVDGCFETRVARANNRHVLALVEGPVAVLTEVDSVSDVFLFVSHAESSPTGACGDDDRRCEECLSSFHADRLFLSAEVNMCQLSVLENVDGIDADVSFKVSGELRSVGLRYGDEVLYACGVVHLTANALCHDCHAESFSCRIDGCRRTGRTASHYDYVVMVFHWFSVVVGFAPHHVLQLLEKDSKVAPSDVQRLTVAVNCGHALDA